MRSCQIRSKHLQMYTQRIRQLHRSLMCTICTRPSCGLMWQCLVSVLAVFAPFLPIINSKGFHCSACHPKWVCHILEVCKSSARQWKHGIKTVCSAFMLIWFFSPTFSTRQQIKTCSDVTPELLRYFFLPFLHLGLIRVPEA